ncbi:MAG: epimerase [Amycolatopsis sp.]|uniref:NAD(P)H-binding protein n=1 Tax=Amycolatopsis sp. TaxID=37632 RepID=UPI00262513ED|nr:NAD(P)H-binding protein [Amycolatopsis sp.]MCU1683358.1 epimerase [Amycolatopsis sp.]
MKVILFGGTGMVGQGVLRECLADPRVDAVLAVGRSATPGEHPKLRQLVHDLDDLPAVKDELSGYDTCFFCLGVSATGMTEAAYRAVTYDLTLSVAGILNAANPGMKLIYVSGAGTDAHGSMMWARVKGETENALLASPLDAYLFRPGYIQPTGGIVSKTKLYRLIYRITTPLFPLIRAVVPKLVTTNAEVGRAMIGVAESGAGQRILGNTEINRLAASQ